MPKGSSPVSSTLLKALSILEIISRSPNGLGLNHICTEAGLSKSSMTRILKAFIAHGYVIQDPVSHRYRLGYRGLEVGSRVLDGPGFQEISRSFLPHLAHLSGESAHLGILEKFEVLFIGQAQPQDPIRLHARIGMRAPGHCTAMGKILLSALPDSQRTEYLQTATLKSFTERTIVDPARLNQEFTQIVTNGYAVDDEEHRPGVRCIAAPVRNQSQDVIAAVSISGPSFRITDDRIQDLADLVKKVARSMSYQLGYSKHEDGGII